MKKFVLDCLRCSMAISPKHRGHLREIEGNGTRSDLNLFPIDLRMVNSQKKRISSFLLNNDVVRLVPGETVENQVTNYMSELGESRAEIAVAEKWIDDMVKKKRSESGQDEHFAFSRDILSKQYKLSETTINRLFRALLVYSFGFYDMLKSIFKHNVRSSEMISNYWNCYLKLIETADPIRNYEALPAIGEQQIHSKDGQQQVLMQRENKLKKHEADLETHAKQLQDSIEIIEEYNEMAKQITSDEEKAEELRLQNENLVDKKLQMEGEILEWIKTIQYHESHIIELSKVSMHNIGSSTSPKPIA